MGWVGRSFRLVQALQKQSLQYWPGLSQWNQSVLGRCVATDQTKSHKGLPSAIPHERAARRHLRQTYLDHVEFLLLYYHFALA